MLKYTKHNLMIVIINTHPGLTYELWSIFLPLLIVMGDHGFSEKILC